MNSLAEDGCDRGGDPACLRQVDGHIAPAEEVLPLVGHDPLDERLELRRRASSCGRKKEPTP